ncbi:MAG: DnaD domain protein [Lachnospiraceae bacterium]|jgi:DnaD/phage-associated family protein|nr:DnaD domain protein [Lachnospiraceae bacterium]
MALRIYQNYYEDAVIVSNLFIDEYMKDANDAQIKIFLYLLRVTSAQEMTSIADIADKFNYPEKDVMRALKYWEKNSLLRIEYDEHRNPVGIHLHNITKPKRPAPISLPTPAPALTATGDKEPRRFYSADDVHKFEKAEDTAQLLFVAEQYLSKTLSAADVMTLIYLTDTLGFSTDLIEYLIEYCVERGKKDLRYIEKVGINWAEEGIKTRKQAAKASRKYDKIVYDVMNALGRNSQPTKSEADYILRWQRDYGFSADIIFEACARTVVAVAAHRFEYCDKILQNWKTAGIQSKADIEQLDLTYQSNKRTIPMAPAKSKGGATMFNNFTQNEYDFEELERVLISNK